MEVSIVARMRTGQESGTTSQERPQFPFPVQPHSTRQQRGQSALNSDLEVRFSNYQTEMATFVLLLIKIIRTYCNACMIHAVTNFSFTESV